MAFVLFSCKKEDNNLGLNIQPPGDKLNVIYSDTTSVVAYSQFTDSIRTDETSVSLFGSMVDPVFGKSTASFYTQFRLSQSSFSFGENPVADSLILSLLYDGQYGDSLSPLTLRVYEMDSQINIDSNYYSSSSVSLKSTLLAEKTFIPNFTDSVIVGTDTLVPHLRVNLGELSSELINKLFEAPADSMETNDSFQNYFYGLYVTAEPVSSQGQIIYFDLVNTLSAMTLYYRNDTDDSLSYAYVINSNCARFQHYDHDYSLADAAFKSQVMEKDTSLGQQVCYIQAMGGVKTFLRFPYIKNYYADGKIALNEARLFLKCSETDPVLSPGKNLILVVKDDSTGYVISEDQQEGTDFFGGAYDKNAHGYWFRITMTVQDLMRSEDPDYGLEIYMSGGAVNANRVLLAGTDPQAPGIPEDRIRLVLTYTRLN